MNDTNQALNGNQKLADAKQAAKTNLGTLDRLNDAQKQALTTQVEQAPDIATVNNVKQNAQNLNNAMTNLSNALQDKTETLNSINFTDANIKLRKMLILMRLHMQKAFYLKQMAAMQVKLKWNKRCNV